MNLPSPSRRRFFAALLFVPAFFGGVSHAFVDEAHSFIMEEATEYVENGFTLRHDYWSGQIEAGKKKLIRHQLFRGNEYWFWVATSLEGAKLQLEVYDDKGQAVSVERTKSDHCTGVRIVPADTGSYYVLLKIESEKHDELDWALVYAYR